MTVQQVGQISQDTGGCRLDIDARTRAWRRQLGALAWAALENLALAAHPSDQGWVAPVGVRDIARGIGVTKDTAARAVTILSSAGLVVFERVEGHEGRRRSGYRLRLPDGMHVRPGRTPDDSDASVAGGACPAGEDSRCPCGQDSQGCPTNGDKPVSALGERAYSQRSQTRPVRPMSEKPRPDDGSNGVVQPTLFGPPSPAADISRPIRSPGQLGRSSSEVR
jgi:hypothetical protein